MIKVNVMPLHGGAEKFPSKPQISPRRLAAGGNSGATTLPKPPVNFIGNGLPQININLSGGPAPTGLPTTNPSHHHQPNAQQLGPLTNEHLIRIVLEIRDSEEPTTSSSKSNQPPRKLSGKTQTSTTQKKSAKDRKFEDEDNDSACSNTS